MLIYLIRHADTVHGRDDVFRGRTDVPLSELGKAQAAACARAIAGKRLKAVYSGPLSRARDTAAAIAAPHGLTPVIEPAFDDIHIGDWEGFSLSEVADKWPRQWQEWRTAPHTFVFPGGERLDDARERAWAALRAAATATAGDAIAIVTHRAVAKLLLLEAVGAPTSSFWCLSQNPCALNLLELRPDGKYTVHSLNDTSHIAM